MHLVVSKKGLKVYAAEKEMDDQRPVSATETLDSCIGEGVPIAPGTYLCVRKLV